MNRTFLTLIICVALCCVPSEARKVKTKTVTHTTTHTSKSNSSNKARQGNMTRDISTSESIKSVTNYTSSDVEVIYSPVSLISIDGSAAMVENTRVEVKQGDVVINYNGNNAVMKNGSLTIKIYSPELSRVSLYGAGDIEIEKLNGTHVNVLIAGSGDVTADVIDGTSVQLQVLGAGDIKVDKVLATSLKTIVNGAGDIRIGNAESTTVDCSVNGAGDITINGIDATSVRANVPGAGDVTLSGTAFTATYVMQGVGSINAQGLHTSRSTRNNTGLGSIKE